MTAVVELLELLSNIGVFLALFFELSFQERHL